MRSLGTGGSVVIQVLKKLFLVTKTVNTHMTIYFSPAGFVYRADDINFVHAA